MSVRFDVETAFSAKGVGRTRADLFALAAGAAALTAALVLVKKSFAEALDFGTEFRKLETLVGIQPKILEEWRQSIKNIGAEFGVLTGQTLPALFQITSGGERGAEALDLLEDAAKATAIGLGDTAAIAKVATAAYQAYGKAAFETVSPVDILGKTIKEGALNVEGLAEVFGQALPLAASLGVGMDQLGGSIAGISRLGLSAAESVTSLRSLLSSIAKPTEASKKALLDAGTSIEEMRRKIREDGLAQALVDLVRLLESTGVSASDIFPNVRALTNVLGTAAAQGDRYVEIAESIADATGFIDEQFEKIKDDPQIVLNRMAGAAEDLRIELGDLLVAGIAPIGDEILVILGELTRLLQFLGDINEVTRELTGGLSLTETMLDLLGRGLGVVNNALKLSATLASRLVQIVARLHLEFRRLAIVLASVAQAVSNVPFLKGVATPEQIRGQATALAELAIALERIGRGGGGGPGEGPDTSDLNAQLRDLKIRIEEAKDAASSMRRESRASLEAMREEAKEQEEIFVHLIKALESIEAPDIEIVVEINPLSLSIAEQQLTALRTRAQEFSQMLRAPVTGVDVNQGRQVESLDVSQQRYLDRVAEENERFLEGLGGLFNQLAGIFDDFGGKFGGFLSELFNVAGSIASAVGRLTGGGGGGGGGLGGLGAALGPIGAVLEIFIAVYNAADALIEASKARDFGLTTSIGISGGQRSGQAVAGHRGALDQEQTMRLFQSMASAIDAFQIALGATIQEMETLGIQVRNDGKKIILTVGDVVFGTYATLQDAIEDGLKIAFSTASIQGLGENVQRAIERQMAGLSIEAFLRLLPELQNLDNMAAGMTLSMSQAVQAGRSWHTALTITSRQLLQTGAALEDVIKLREAHIASMKREIEVQGLQIAGVSTGLPALVAWLDQAVAFQEIAEAEAAAQAALADHAEEAADEFDHLGGIIDRGDDAAGRAGRGLIKFFGSVGDLEDAFADAETAQRMLSDAMIEAVKVASALGEMLSVWGRIIGFLEQYGGSAEDIEEAKLIAAEMEFNLAQIQIALAVTQLKIWNEMGLVSDEMLAKFEDFATTVLEMEFPGLPEELAPDTGRRGGGRRRARLQAAADFDTASESIRQSLAGVSENAQGLAQDLDALRAAAAEGRVPTAELAAALADFTELWLRDLAAPWHEISAGARESEAQTAFRLAGEQAAQALADAMAAAAQSPEAFQDAQAAIQQGLRDLQRQIGRDVLEGLGGPMTQLRQEGREAADAIEFLMGNLSELGVSAAAVARTVRDNVVPQLIDMAIAEAERVGDLDRAQELMDRRARIERQLTLARIAVWEQMLLAANALDDALRTMFANLREDLATVSAELAGGGFAGGGAGPFGNEPGSFGPQGPGAGAGGPRIFFNDGTRKGLQHGLAGAAGAGGARTLAQIIEDLLGQGMTPMEALSARWAGVMEEIAKATGTALEREQALGLARELLAKQTKELMRQQLSSIQDLADEINRDILHRKAPRQAVISARGAFEGAQANLDVNNADSVDAFVQAASDYRGLLAGYDQVLASFGGSAAGNVAALDESMAQTLVGILSGAGIGPAPSLSAGTGGLFASASSLSAPADAAGGVRVTVDNGRQFGELSDRIDRLTFEIEGLRTDQVRRQPELREHRAMLERGISELTRSA